MSRVGKLSVHLDGATCDIQGRDVIVKGPKGELRYTLPPHLSVTVSGDTVSVASETGGERKFHGLARMLIANMITGVTKGFTKHLELSGVGYRAQVQGETLVLSVGYSHPVEITAPAGISFQVEKNVIAVSGIDKQQVGEVAAQIRKVRPPEPYKGKGILYQGERIRRKAGKSAVKAGGAK